MTLLIMIYGFEMLEMAYRVKTSSLQYYCYDKKPQNINQ